MIDWDVARNRCWSIGLAFGERSDCLPPAQSNLLPLTQLKTGARKGYDWSFSERLGRLGARLHCNNQAQKMPQWSAHVPLHLISQLDMHVAAELMHVSYVRISRLYHRRLVLSRVCILQSRWRGLIPYPAMEYWATICRRSCVDQRVRSILDLR